jgi:hypothetical protein
MHVLFDITPDHIKDLTDEDLRALIARLCEVELRRRGLPVTAVTYGGNQNAADGGIDVRVALPPDTEIAGAIPRPNTGFQAKAEDMPAAKIGTEMRPRMKAADGSELAPLRPSIRDLADKGGAYVIVSSKGSVADGALSDRRQAMREAVADLANPEAPHLDFYDRTRMATWVRDHPGEILWVRARIGQPLQGWEPFANWSRAPDPAGKNSEYLKDDTTRIWDGQHQQEGQLTILEGIRRLRSALREPRGIVRLTGLSGTGKTRLLEALFDTSIGDDALDPALAVYVDCHPVGGFKPPA